MLPSSAQTAVYDALLLDAFDDVPSVAADAASTVYGEALADFHAADLEALAALFPPDVEPPTPPPNSKPKKCGPGGNNARKRQREELRALRESAAALETQLAGIQGRVPISPGTTRRCTGDKRARQITELENVHLSKLVSDHLKVAQSFEKALRKHRPLSAADILAEKPPSCAFRNSPQLKETPLESSIPTPEDVAMFEILSENVEMRYHEVEKVFRAVGLDECRTDMREATLDTSSEGGVRLKFKSSRLIPFSVQTINETAVKIGKSQNTNGPGHVVQRVGTKVSFKKQFQVGEAQVKACGVSKRYIETDRIVMIWEGVSEWPGEPGGEAITIEEKGWGIIQPYPQTTTKSSSRQAKSEASPLSMLQSYIYMKPGLGASSSAVRQAPQPKHVAILSEVVMPSYEEMFRARMQHLENMLMEESLQRRIAA